MSFSSEPFTFLVELKLGRGTFDFADSHALVPYLEPGVQMTKQHPEAAEAALALDCATKPLAARLVKGITAEKRENCLDELPTEYWSIHKHAELPSCGQPVEVHLARVTLDGAALNRADGSDVLVRRLREAILRHEIIQLDLPTRGKGEASLNLRLVTHVQAG